MGQNIFLLVIILAILITFSIDYVCWEEFDVSHPTGKRGGRVALPYLA